MFALYRVPPDVILPELGRPLGHYLMLRPADPVAPLRFWREYPPQVTANVLSHLELFDLVTAQYRNDAPLPPDAELLLRADTRLAQLHPPAHAQSPPRLRLVK